jgi:hypothetical protein
MCVGDLNFLRLEPTSFKLLLTENCTGDCCDLLEQLQHRDKIKSRQVKKLEFSDWQI